MTITRPKIDKDTVWHVAPSATPKKDLREAIKKHIRLYPEKFDMHALVDLGERKCLWGFVNVLSGKNYIDADMAKDAIGVDRTKALFGTDAWPRDLQLLYHLDPVEAGCQVLD